MNITDLIDELRIPPRRSNHRGEWVPLYLEPLPGSGERLCIGVIAADGAAVRSMSVPQLERLQCAYGIAAQSIAWSAKLAMLEASAVAEQRGLNGLGEALNGIEGLSIGDRRIGGGRDLDDVAMLALRQSSMLITHEASEQPLVSASVGPERASPLLKAVQRVVVTVRPELRDSFGLHFSFSSAARPTAYGFVGHRLVANFASLGGGSADVLGSQIDRAKARLWDLEQLQKGILRDVFGAPMRDCVFELLACPPPPPSKPQLPKRPMSSAHLKEAAETLEREADKFDIRWRYLKNPTEVAQVIMEKEAA